MVLGTRPWRPANAVVQLGLSICGFQKFAQHEFAPIDLFFITMGPSFSQNLWVPFHTFQKSVGSMEPTEPTLTTLL